MKEAEGRSQAWLSGILSIATDAIISVDGRQSITLFSDGAEKLFGYSRDELIGQPLAILLPERFRAAHPAHIHDFAASKATARRMGERQEIWARHKDGHEFPAEASISKFELGDELIFTVVLRDVSERKQVEQGLEQRIAERTAELSAVLDAVPDGILTCDIEWRVRMVNETLAKLFGYQRQELIGMPAHDLYATPTDSDGATSAWRSWEADEAQRSVMIACRRKDGTIFTAMMLGNAVRDSSGQIVSRVGLIRDMTDELMREKVLQQAQRMEAFGQLTGGVAHDFNNLLTVITGNQELLAMRLQDPKGLTLLQRSQEAAEMGARLTSRLLTFARRGRLEPTLLSMNDQIIGMFELLRRSIGEDVTLTTNLAPSLWAVRADASEIENAILNLAINARDAMPSGGTLVIQTTECCIDDGEIGGERKLVAGEYVRLSVSDSGTGMTPEVLQRAFEPFFTTKQPGKGSGLGLSTIWGFVQQSGGSVTVYSDVGRGTTVNIYLPRAHDGRESAETERAADGAVSIAKGETILLVEDNPAVREVGRKRLEELGYRVLEAENGPAAIEQLEAAGQEIDVVFSDIVMPGGMSGFDLARWVAINAAAVKVLLTSGFPDEVATVQGELLPAARLLRKPYSLFELARAMRAVLDG